MILQRQLRQAKEKFTLLVTHTDKIFFFEVFPFLLNFGFQYIHFSV